MSICGRINEVLTSHTTCPDWLMLYIVRGKWQGTDWKLKQVVGRLLHAENHLFVVVSSGLTEVFGNTY